MWADGFVSVGGKRLECRCWGPEPSDGRAVVLMHEGLGCVALWRDFPLRLQEASGLPVMAYSRAGHGQSDAADLPRDLDWMTHEATAIVPKVLAPFGITRPIYLGHSDGASIAAICASVHAHTEAAILIAPHFFTEEEGISEIASVNAQFDDSDMAARMAKYHRDPVAMFRGWADVWLHPQFRAWQIESVLPQVGCPLLAMQGRQDQYGTLAQMEAVRRHVAHAQVEVLEDCQHVPHLEQPAVTLALALQFMHHNASL